MVTMDRQEFLKKMRMQAERLYDRFAPAYWVTYGTYDSPVHEEFLGKFLKRLMPGSDVLSAGCGAGRFDGILVDAGHNVLGIDQSAGMLARAREHFPLEQFPRLKYEKRSLQEMDFHNQFDGATCLDALEHIPPEDWQGILQGFAEALKPGGWLYITVEEPDWEEVRESYERSRAHGLPVVFGEVVAEDDRPYEQALTLGPFMLPGNESDGSVYHYHPSMEQVHSWLERAGFRIEDEGHGLWYAHLLMERIRG